MSTNNFKVGDRVRLNQHGRTIHCDSVHGLIVTVLEVEDVFITVDWSEAGSHYRRESNPAANFERVLPRKYRVSSKYFDSIDLAIDYATVRALDRKRPVKVTPIY